jgi:hypothetical protein
MKTYERISQLDKLGLEVEEYKFPVPKNKLKGNTLLAKFDDGGEEYELENWRETLTIRKYRIFLPRHYTNVAKQAKDRDVYLKILGQEGVDINLLEDKIIYCRGHFIWLPEVSYYCRLPVRYYLKTAKTGKLPTH